MDAKENGPCVKCGSWKDLEINHIESIFKETHRICSYSKVKQELELAKCEVLCSDCHKLVSATQKAKGERQGNSKLSEEDITMIRDMYDGVDYTYRSLASIFNVNFTVIGKIIRNESWV